MPKHPLKTEPEDEALDEGTEDEAPPPPKKVLFEAPTKEEFLALEDEFLELQGDDSDAALSRKHQIRQQLKKLGPHAGCGKEPMVEINVPQPVGSGSGMVNGDYFRINNKVYHGKCFVPACEARQLAYMIDRNRQVDRDRFRGQQKQLGSYEIKTTG